MIESIVASLIANMLWDEIKVNKIENKLEVIEEAVIHNNDGIKWLTEKVK
jgi:hypothetical protein|tara:strand:- start:658 stop:807 length:150 start_codon:yes stop_codon:yes gene_type:complete